MLVSIGQKHPAADLEALLLECHARIRRFVGFAQSLATTTDAPAHDVVEVCGQCIRYFGVGLPLHVRDEEDSLAPRLRVASEGLALALDTMEEEHASHHALLAALLAALANLATFPTDAAARARLASATAPVAEAFAAHLELEERVLFPAIATALTPAQHGEILAELQLRRGRVRPAH